MDFHQTGGVLCLRCFYFNLLSCDCGFKNKAFEKTVGVGPRLFTSEGPI